MRAACAEKPLVTAKPLSRRSLGATRGRLEARGNRGRSNLFTVKALPDSAAAAISLVRSCPRRNSAIRNGSIS